MNGHSSRSSRRRHHQDSDRAMSHGSDREEEEITVRRSLKRKTARAAVNKIKLLDVSDEEDDEEDKPRRSSSRLRHTTRASKRTAVIQSSSDSDGEPSTQGRQKFCLVLFIQIDSCLHVEGFFSPFASLSSFSEFRRIRS